MVQGSTASEQRVVLPLRKPYMVSRIALFLAEHLWNFATKERVVSFRLWTVGRTWMAGGGTSQEDCAFISITALLDQLNGDSHD
jgi:hypothetical protein